MALAFERFTELPLATNANLDDIICAVQGYVDPSNLGTSAQLNLSQIADLFQNSPNLSYPGNPNSNVAGILNQICWDSIDGILYVCITPGIASVAVWSKSITLTAGSGVTIQQNGDIIEISASGTSASTETVTILNTNMASDTNYIVNYTSGGPTGRAVLLLPASSSAGDLISISGLSQGGWQVTQNASQILNVGSVATTTGTGGSISSTNGFDSLSLRCLVSNLQWAALGAPQSSGLTII